MFFRIKLLKMCKFLAAVCLSAVLISCASTTTIRVTDQDDSIDRDVKIYIDGSYKGKGEVVYSDTKIVGSITQVTLKKKGCRSNIHSLFRSEKLQIGALIGGLFVWVPFLWIMGYNPMHLYEFQCEKR